MPSLISTTDGLSSMEGSVHFCSEQVTERSLTESELSKLGFFVPRSGAQNLEEVGSSSSSLESSDSDLSYFLSEVHRGVVDVEMLGNGGPGFDTPSPVNVFTGQAEIVLESDGCSVTLSDVTEDELPNGSDSDLPNNPDSVIADDINSGFPNDNLVDNFFPSNPPAQFESI